ncbi:class II fructose-bisphosphate aldolase [Vallitalea pronyensis]|uniref:Class II fructose-bisphosphate aldolase n=1 Tax=Vallitalea pronyensis TaxID=1348613 RepID=A0A8J8MN30_9FIRM|nr:class II fructose-bisphosphate aldolase [Vallitalea pronyensis]QUI24947.1 class II fructose-bisphosphate aldolase [Vallitalea pronyensis]
MPLVSSLPLIKKAKEKKAAIAAFNIHNLETIQAVIEGASEERAPVIIQTTPGTLRHAGIEYIGAIVKKAADMVDIPVALHVDHCPSFDTIVHCIRNHYTSVMIDGAHLDYEENVALVKRVTEMAHAVGMQVEGEIGKIGGVEDDMFVNEDEAALTVPSEAKQFVEDTGIDTLAIAIGTAHGMYKGEPKLDFERLSEIEAMVDVPLVLHGASGVPDASIKEAIKRGIAKINIATELKNPMAKAIVSTFEKNKDENDPRNYMGAAREAVKKVVKEKIRLCGSNGLADEL